MAYEMKKSTLNKVEEENGGESEVIQPISLEDGAKLSPLHIAAIMGNKAKMAALLKEHKDDIDKGDKIGRTPLIFSILGDRYDCAEALIKAGADVNKTDVDERTALHWAAYQGNHRFVKLLLDKGAKQGCQDKEGRTPLHLSLSHDNIKVMGKLLKDADVDCRDGNGMTPLHFSVAYERVEHTKMLLHAKASPDCQDNDKKTVLHWAKANKEMAIVQRLLDYERVMLILNTKDSDGRTALHLAVAADNKALVRFLTSLDDCSLSELDHMHRTPMHWAAILGHTSIVELLLDRGSDPSIPDKNGVRPLHYAAQNNFGKTVNAMLQHENVKDVPDDDKRTALMWAAAKGAYDALSVLISHKQDILAADRAGATALHMAAEGGHLQCVTLLLQHQAGVNVLDKQQYTPLFCACQMGHKEVVESLLLHGAAVDLEDKEGRTPLHWAAVGGRTDICGMLLDHGLNPAKKDTLGRPALHYAAYGGFYTCMALLLEFRVDVDARDSTGVTALHWACASGSLDAVKLLFRYGAFPNFVELEGDKLTPLDYAIIREHMDVAQFMIEHSAFTIAGIQDEAATVIQAAFRGYRLRKSFEDQKQLFILHEKRRKETRKRQVFTDIEESPDSFTKKDQDHSLYDAMYATMGVENSSNTSQLGKSYFDESEQQFGPLEPEYEEDVESQINEIISEKYRYQKPKQDTELTLQPKNANFSVKSNNKGIIFNDNTDDQSRKFIVNNTVFDDEISPVDFQEKSMNKMSYGNKDRMSDLYLRRDISAGKDQNEEFSTINQDNSDDYSNVEHVKIYEEEKTDSEELTNQDTYDAQRNNGKIKKQFHETLTDYEDSITEKTLIEPEQGNISKIKKKNEIRCSKPNKKVIDKLKQIASYKDVVSESSVNGGEKYLKPWQIYEREQRRANLVRLKIESAIVIQRAFRNYLVKSQKTSNKYIVSEDEITQEKDKIVFEEIAALMIQLHWRNYVKNKLVKKKIKENGKREKEDLRLIVAEDQKQEQFLNAEIQELPKRTGSRPHTTRTISKDINKSEESSQANWRTKTFSGDDHHSMTHSKSRPKGTGVTRRHDKKASLRSSDTQYRLKSGLSRGTYRPSTPQTAGLKVYIPQSWSSNLQKFPLRH